jgi:hypothetical protein
MGRIASFLALLAFVFSAFLTKIAKYVKSKIGKGKKA